MTTIIGHEAGIVALLYGKYILYILQYVRLTLN